MSISQLITSRPQADLINEGMKLSTTGIVAGAVVDQVLFALPADRAVIVCGFTISSSIVGPVLVSLGFKLAPNPTKTFFSGYVSLSGGPIVVMYQLGDWYRGSVNEPLVITTDGGPIAYTVDTRVTAIPTITGYIEHEGTTLHAGRAYFPDQNGNNRGQM